MIASLPMYDWPETQAANDMLWQQMAEHLRSTGIKAPANLTRSDDLDAVWLSPDLLVAQTCSYPLETTLRGKVQYVATPSYQAEGCEEPGHYRSVVLMHGQRPHMQVPKESYAVLPDWKPYTCFAYNSLNSMSGYHALKRDAGSLPSLQIHTGSHRASIIAVGNGAADLCAVDCVTWAMALKHEPASKDVYVAGWTKPRPGLPLISALHQSAAAVAGLRNAAGLVFSSVILDPPTEI
jgi:ABC-type phosphate/phosphonate transport system substrate-binding protein